MVDDRFDIFTFFALWGNRVPVRVAILVALHHHGLPFGGKFGHSSAQVKIYPLGVFIVFFRRLGKTREEDEK